MLTAGLQHTAPIEPTTAQTTTPPLQDFHETLSKVITPDTDEGTFLRGSEFPNTNPVFKQEFKPFTQAVHSSLGAELHAEDAEGPTRRLPSAWNCPIRCLIGRSLTRTRR